LTVAMEPRSGGEAMNQLSNWKGSVWGGELAAQREICTRVTDEKPITVPSYSLGVGGQFPPKGGRLPGR